MHYCTQFTNTVKGVAFELDMISERWNEKRLRGTVIPLLYEGTPEESIITLLEAKLYADFTAQNYFETTLSLIEKLYGFSQDGHRRKWKNIHEAVRNLSGWLMHV